MGTVLYYSNFCENCKKIVGHLSKSSVKNDLHYICIDKRIKKNNLNYVVLENMQEILLPEKVNRVPALMILNGELKILFGDDIIDYLKPVEQVNTAVATNFNGEPSAFNMNNGLTDVHSDIFSFLDQDDNELSAKGDGGLRQLYNYASINNNDKIETPEENYLPDKVNDESLKNYQDDRNKIK
tara:strand:+ start:440 stop:988 length:549 start_codon:yes stop_codon:yes gene_type:complete